MQVFIRQAVAYGTRMHFREYQDIKPSSKCRVTGNCDFMTNLGRLSDSTASQTTASSTLSSIHIHRCGIGRLPVAHGNGLHPTARYGLSIPSVSVCIVHWILNLMWHDGAGSDRLHLSIRFSLKLYPTWSVKSVPMTLLSIPGMDLK
jgi:hypothetical protein